jgi:UDP-glucuronate decarboxylase
MDKKNNKNIIVTGGAGFIGSHLCESLVKNGFNVLCIDNFSSGDESFISHLLQLPNFELINHDLTSEINLNDYREAKKFDIEFLGVSEIYHLACPSSPGNYDKFAMSTLFANSHATKNVLDMAVKYNSKVLFSSSSVVYGEPAKEMTFVKEEDLGLVDNLNEKSCYNEGKRFAESICYYYSKYKGVDVKIARIFSIYGPRMKIKNGRLIADLLSSAIDNKPLVLDCRKEDIKSYCYINDLLEAFYLIMENGSFGPYNVGNPSPVKMIEVLKTIKDLTFSDFKCTFTEKKHSRKPLPDLSRIKKEFGWFPLTPIEKGFKETIAFTKANRNNLDISSIDYKTDLDEKSQEENPNKDSNNLFKSIFGN